MVELGKVDICTKYSMMTFHLTLTLLRHGHFDALFCIFAYLKAHLNSEMIFDPSEIELDMAQFTCEDWNLNIYGDAEEELLPQNLFEDSGPDDMPKPRGMLFRIVTYVGCELGVDCVTHILYTGFWM